MLPAAVEESDELRARSQPLTTLDQIEAQRGCPLSSTSIAFGVNLALGRGSQAGQAVAAQGPRGVLASTSFTRGANLSVGAGSVASASGCRTSPDGEGLGAGAACRINRQPR